MAIQYFTSGVVLDCIDSLFTTSTNTIIYLHYLVQILIITIVYTNTIIYLHYLVQILIITIVCTNTIIYLHYLVQILIITIVCTNTIIYLQYLVPIPIIGLLRICHFPTGMLGQVWYLIVWIPDLCTLTYFYSLGEINLFQII